MRSMLVLITWESNLLPQEKAYLLSIHLEAHQALRLPWIPILTWEHCFLTGHRAKHGSGWASQGCFLTRQALQLKPCLFGGQGISLWLAGASGLGAAIYTGANTLSFQPGIMALGLSCSFPSFQCAETPALGVSKALDIGQNHRIYEIFFKIVKEKVWREEIRKQLWKKSLRAVVTGRRVHGKSLS